MITKKESLNTNMVNNNSFCTSKEATNVLLECINKAEKEEKFEFVAKLSVISTKLRSTFFLTN